MTDYYTVLEVPRNATLDIIKAAYRRLCKLFHPDKNPGSPQAEARMKDINAAWEVLGDDTKRHAYDNECVRRDQAEANRRAQTEQANAQRATSPSSQTQWWKDNWGWVVGGVVVALLILIALWNSGGKKPRARFA